jgi:hypothetical protein
MESMYARRTRLDFSCKVGLSLKLELEVVLFLPPFSSGLLLLLRVRRHRGLVGRPVVEHWNFHPHGEGK